MKTKLLDLSGLFALQLTYLQNPLQQKSHLHIFEISHIQTTTLYISAKHTPLNLFRCSSIAVLLPPQKSEQQSVNFSQTFSGTSAYIIHVSNFLDLHASVSALSTSSTLVRLSGLLQLYSSSRSLHPSGGTCPQPLPSCMCTGGVIRSFTSRLGQPLSGLTATPRR